MFKKSFQCDFCHHWNISFIWKSFYQILLTWSKTYTGHVILQNEFKPTGELTLISLIAEEVGIDVKGVQKLQKQ